MGKDKKRKIKHPQFRDLGPAPASTGWEMRHHEAATLAREHPGRWFAIYSTGVEAAYATVSRYRSGKRRPHAYDPPGFEFRHARVEGRPQLREICVRYVEPKDGDR